MEHTPQIHPALRWTGWIALFLSLAIPLGNSLVAMAVFRNPSCESVRWSFAPLLATCEPATAQLTAYGWFGTALVLTLFASATGIAAAGIARSGALRGAQRADAVHFGMTLLAVVAIAATALVRPWDPSQPVNAWLLFASAGGMAAYIVSSLILVFRLAAKHRL